jgi:phosphoglycolate phosphatase-like HAD superfamily hydrolase
MLMQAQKKYNIDLSAAVMVGDSAKDIECARNAGCGSAVLVRTGNGPKAEKALACNNVFPDYVARDLKDAACWIIETRAETRT